MGSYCSRECSKTCSCCSPCCHATDEEIQPFATSQGHQEVYHPADQTLPDHDLINKRVRLVIEGEYHGALVKQVFAIVRDEEDFYEEAQLLLDDDLNLIQVPVTNLEVINNIQLGDFCVVHAKPDSSFLVTKSGFARFIHPESSVTKTRYISLHMLGTDYNNTILRMDFKDCQLVRAPPPVTEEASSESPPISTLQLKHFLGRNKGIQGKSNSCYLDTLLFSLFTFTDAALTAIRDSENIDESNFRILCHSIIYPLRSTHFVSKDHVEFLRNHMAKLTSNASFEDESRDLYEAFEALFSKMLKWKAPLSVSSIETNDYRFDPIYSLQLMDNAVDIPNAQSLLYTASWAQKFCIEKVPRLFILQLPREIEKHQVTFPDLELDLGPTLFASAKSCAQCDQVAQLQFFERFEEGGLPGTFLCRSCAEALELHCDLARELPAPEASGKSRLILSAIICIERSHYNCFARCGAGHNDDRWVFFDSMSDQEELLDLPTLRHIQFNIPLVEEVPQLTNWLSKAPERWIDEGRSLDGFLADLNPTEREKANRLFRYAYMLIYTRIDE